MLFKQCRNKLEFRQTLTSQRNFSISNRVENTAGHKVYRTSKSNVSSTQRDRARRQTLNQDLDLDFEGEQTFKKPLKQVNESKRKHAKRVEKVYKVTNKRVRLSCE